MNCRTCGYALWNLVARSCPECNTPFVPSQFLFRKHSVAFCCPECDQPYYGGGEGGHLEPRAFNCVKCGKPTYEDEMVLRPTQGVVEERTRFYPVPWFDREIRSIVVRLVKTTVWALFMPGQLGARLPMPERPAAALGFAALWTALFCLPALVLSIVVGTMIRPAALASGLLFGIVIWAFVALPIWALVTHLCLVVSGPRHAGYARTLACHAYLIPLCAPLAVPILGLYLAPFVLIAWTLLGASTLRSGQRISWWRGSLAVSVFPLTLTAITLAIIFLVVVPFYNRTVTAAQATFTPVSTPVQQGETISSLMRTYARTNAGQGPAHMSKFLCEGTLQSTDLLSGIKYRSDARASIAGRPLMMFEFGADATGNQLVKSWLQTKTPAGPITSHRLGDVVFTYHGIDLNAPADPNLWIFVITTEPPRFPRVAFGGSQAPAGPPALAIAQADGTVAEIADADFAAALKDQNAIRIKHGLAGLPDPRQILANDFTTPADAPPP